MSKGVNIVTPNKKGFSAELTLYEGVVAASLKTGARLYNESTVGAGLPIVSTIKDLVATGDKVRMKHRLLTHRRGSHCTSPWLIYSRGHENGRYVLRHIELHFQRILGRKERGWAELLLHRLNRKTERPHGAFQCPERCEPFCRIADGANLEGVSVLADSGSPYVDV